jgi:F420-dependent oxidoreductase-like protein
MSAEPGVPVKLAAMIRIPPGGAAAAAEQARAYEDAGVDVLAVAESYGADAVSALGFLAGQTLRAELMAQILPIYSRTPALIAMTAVGLDIVSQGRFILGLGVSGPQVIEGWHGLPYDAPLRRTREVIEICRQVWRRERLTYSGAHYQIPLPPGTGTSSGRALKLIDVPVRLAIPVFVAALGPANVELTARAANGWVPFLYIPELAEKVWGEPLTRGLAARPDDIGPLQIMAGGPMAIGPDVTHLRDLDRDHLALYVGGMGARGRNFYNRLVRQYGFGAEATQVQDLYLAGRREEAAAALPAALLEGTSLIGDDEYIARRLAAYAAGGVTILQVDPIGADPIGDVRRLRALIDGARR